MEKKLKYEPIVFGKKKVMCHVKKAEYYAIKKSKVKKMDWIGLFDKSSSPTVKKKNAKFYQCSEKIN